MDSSEYFNAFNDTDSMYRLSIDLLLDARDAISCSLVAIPDKETAIDRISGIIENLEFQFVNTYVENKKDIYSMTNEELAVERHRLEDINAIKILRKELDDE